MALYEEWVRIGSDRQQGKPIESMVLTRFFTRLCERCKLDGYTHIRGKNMGGITEIVEK
jgi:hypothetical protein